MDTLAVSGVPWTNDEWTSAFIHSPEYFIVILFKLREGSSCTGGGSMYVATVSWLARRPRDTVCPALSHMRVHILTLSTVCGCPPPSFLGVCAPRHPLVPECVRAPSPSRVSECVLAPTPSVLPVLLVTLSSVYLCVSACTSQLWSMMKNDEHNMLWFWHHAWSH